MQRIFSFLFPVIFLIANLGQAAVLYFGGQQIIAGTLTIGEWQKFSLYLVLVFFPLGQLGFIITQMSQAAASANRVYEIFDAPNEVTDKPGALPLPPVQGNVEFAGVSFRYFGSSEPVLKGVSFRAQPGETIAILGATGSGKSSIINLIPRFYDVTGGKVLVDGHDVRDVTLESLRTPDRHRAAGDQPLHRLAPRQHCLWPARCHRRRSVRRRHRRPPRTTSS